jgi:hypothetical protein
MRKLTLRHQVGLWIALGLTVVLAVVAYAMTRPRSDPVPDLLPPSPRDRASEVRLAMQLPEHTELVSYSAKENRPLTAAVVVRVGELTNYPNYWIRVKALDLLGKAPDDLKPYAAALVAARLKDEDGLVRQIALHTLAALGAKEFVPQIRELLNNPDHREVAKRALEMLGAGE